MANTNQNLVETQALEIMNPKNSWISSESNRLLSILEWWELTLWLRSRITAHLTTSFTITPDEVKTLQSKNAIRKKIAYLVSLDLTTAGSTLPPPDKTTIINKINNIITDLETNFLKTQDFSESAVIRLSALNNFVFNPSLTSQEKAKLTWVAKKIAELVKWDIHLSADLNLNNEWDAQKIYKLKTLINALIKNWKLQYDDPSVTTFQNDFEPKLKDLYDLDKQYHTLNSSRNAFYRIQRNHWTVKVLNKSEYTKLSQVTTKLAWKDMSAYFKDVFNKDITNLDSGIIENELGVLKSTPLLIEALNESNIKESVFDKYYLFYFSQEILKKSKIDFDTKKRDVFKDKTRDFEWDMNTWRKMQRDRIVEFSRNHDVTSLINIFDRDRKLFVLKKSFKWVFKNLDADDLLIVDWLKKVIENKYSSLSKWNQKCLLNTILYENCWTNELYYGDTNKFLWNNDETVMKDVLRWTNKTWVWLQKVEKFTTPLLKWLIKFGQWTLEFVWKQGSAIINWTSWKVWSILWWMNSKLQSKATTKWWKAIKLIPQSALLLTKPLEWWAKLTNATTTTVTWFVWTAYTWLNENIKNASDGKIDDLFDILTKSYSKSLSLLWQWVESTWESWYDWLDNKQKRKVLEDFYETRTSQNVRSILDAIDIQTKLQDSSPYIFGDEEDDILINEESVDEKDKLAKETFKAMSKKIKPIKDKISIKTSSPNEHIAEAMKELEQLFKEFDQTLSSDEDFVDKKASIEAVIDKIVNYLWDWTKWCVFEIEQQINVLNDATIWKIKLKRDDITNITTQIITPIWWKSPWEQIKALTETQRMHQEDLKNMEKELKDLKKAKGELFTLVDPSWNNFSKILYDVKPKLIVVNNAYIATTFDKSIYDNASKELIKVLKSLNI